MTFIINTKVKATSQRYVHSSHLERQLCPQKRDYFAFKRKQEMASWKGVPLDRLHSWWVPALSKGFNETLLCHGMGVCLCTRRMLWMNGKRACGGVVMVTWVCKWRGGDTVEEMFTSKGINQTPNSCTQQRATHGRKMAMLGFGGNHGTEDRFWRFCSVLKVGTLEQQF